MKIRTFSGTHDWHSSVLNDADADQHTASLIIQNIELGRCPRCEGPLPEDRYAPAGSRITKCRSIPICSRCGSDEADQCVDRRLSPASAWPVDRVELDRQRQAREASAVRITVSLDDVFTNTIDGAHSILPMQHNTGGWAQYGRPPAG